MASCVLPLSSLSLLAILLALVLALCPATHAASLADPHSPPPPPPAPNAKINTAISSDNTSHLRIDASGATTSTMSDLAPSLASAANTGQSLVPGGDTSVTTNRPLDIWENLHPSDDFVDVEETGEVKVDNSATRETAKGAMVSTVVLRKSGNSNVLSISENSGVEPPDPDTVVRGIMENFADDFESPPDAHLSEDFFNREPYYYDVYYDNYDENNDNAQTSERSKNAEEINAVKDNDALLSHAAWQPKEEESSSPLDPAEDDSNTTDFNAVALEDNAEVASIQNTLDLQLLGVDLQAELGYVLEQLTNGSQRNRRHQTPVRHSDPHGAHSGGLAVGLVEGTTCPPPVHSLPPGLCGASPCTSHMMCYPSKMCCFNGCTYTCTQPVLPPPVIDWVEDSASHLPVLDPSNPSLPLRFEDSPLSYGTGVGETIRLPGGCTLSITKYEELKQFMTADSIQDCLCSGGEVVCLVKSSPSE